MIQTLEKSLMRKKMLALLADNSEKAASCSLIIQKRIIESHYFVSAERIGCYSAVGWEVPLDLVIKECRAKNKVVALPAWVEAGYYSYKVWNSCDQLCAGRYGIKEPLSSEIIAVCDLDLVLVPGIAFDRRGHRLGRGKGHYDQILKNVKDNKTVIIGIAYSWQIVDRIPSNDLDAAMDILITEEGMISGAIQNKNTEGMK